MRPGRIILPGCFRKYRVCLIQVFCNIRDVHCIIAQTFKFTDYLIILVQYVGMCFQLNVRKESHQIPADVIRHGINGILFLLYDFSLTELLELPSIV